jgi:hypothetical protein
MRVMTAPKIWPFWFSVRLTPGGAGPKSPLTDIVALEGVARKIDRTKGYLEQPAKFSIDQEVKKSRT